MSILGDHWRRYEPTSETPWNLRRAVHLHRRAGFAATWTELQRDVAGDPQDAVARLLEGRARIDAQPSDYESTVRLLVEAAVSSQLERRVKAAWVYRMLFSPDPLQERLTLTWHNYFPTSNRKVNNLAWMQEQNEVFRRLGRGPFDKLLGAVVRTPAMLVWLDADKNRAGQPNENLARELMELFTIGVGSFTETDVREAARALTGWTVSGDTMRFDRRRHDEGEKTLLGRSGKLNGDDILAHLVAQPHTARRIARVLIRSFMGEAAVEEPAASALAEGLREHGLDIGWAVETIIRSQRFFAADNINARVAGPPEYVVGAVRALECFQPPPSTLLLADWTARMDQDLFYPPNVGGWSDGRAWLTSAAVVARANYAAALVSGRLTHSAGPPDLAGLAERHANTKDIPRAVQWFGELLFGGLPVEAIQTLTSLARAQASTAGGELQTALLAMLSRPEAHFA